MSDELQQRINTLEKEVSKYGSATKKSYLSRGDDELKESAKFGGVVALVSFTGLYLFLRGREGLSMLRLAIYSALLGVVSVAGLRAWKAYKKKNGS